MKHRWHPWTKPSKASIIGHVKRWNIHWIAYDIMIFWPFELSSALETIPSLPVVSVWIEECRGLVDFTTLRRDARCCAPNLVRRLCLAMCFKKHVQQFSGRLGQPKVSLLSAFEEEIGNDLIRLGHWVDRSWCRKNQQLQNWTPKRDFSFQVGNLWCSSKIRLATFGTHIPWRLLTQRVLLGRSSSSLWNIQCSFVENQYWHVDLTYWSINL